MSSLQAARDLLGATLALAKPTLAEPKHFETQKEAATSGHYLGIWICTLLVISAVALCVFGICKLVKKCKAKLSRSKLAENAVVSGRDPIPPVFTSQPRAIPVLPHCSKVISSDTSTLSTGCRSPREATSPPTHVKLFRQPPQLPSLGVSTPFTCAYGVQDPPSIEQLCHQKYSGQQQRLASQLVSEEITSPTRQTHYLGFWRRR